MFSPELCLNKRSIFCSGGEEFCMCVASAGNAANAWTEFVKVQGHMRRLLHHTFY